eukprot:480866-Pyramimonas_sp.AAC.1
MVAQGPGNFNSMQYSRGLGVAGLAGPSASPGSAGDFLLAMWGVLDRMAKCQNVAVRAVG